MASTREHFSAMITRLDICSSVRSLRRYATAIVILMARHWYDRYQYLSRTRTAASQPIKSTFRFK
jgi:hypothetical protein